MTEVVKAWIGLGGNLGDPHQTIINAVQMLRTTPGVASLQISPCFRTKPVQATGPDFCNAVAGLDTTLSAPQLLELLLAIEARHGRTRDHWHAPRTLDLDLIAFGTTRITSSQLTLPHPRAHERAFVLMPLCELDGSVLLGPPDAAALMPARDWLARLSLQSQSEVVPW
jgi:2-amino-4-hydroxy-6-hydroxymethyldihydropteridine diphosphokinase